MRGFLGASLLAAAVLIATPAQAAQISLKSIVEGNQTIVDVYITGVEDLIAFDFFVGFDNTNAAFRSVTAGSLLPLESFVQFSPVAEVIGEDGELVLVPIPDFSPVQILGVITGLTPGVGGDGILATLFFQTLGNDPGIFDLAVGTFLNSGFEQIPVEVASPPQPVPEPSTLALLGIGLAAMARKRLKRQTLG
jgi:hypothetical protein